MPDCSPSVPFFLFTCEQNWKRSRDGFTHAHTRYTYTRPGHTKEPMFACRMFCGTPTGSSGVCAVAASTRGWGAEYFDLSKRRCHVFLPPEPTAFCVRSACNGPILLVWQHDRLQRDRLLLIFFLHSFHAIVKNRIFFQTVAFCIYTDIDNTILYKFI